MQKIIRCFLGVGTILLLLFGQANAGDDFIGGLRNVQGPADIVRQGRTISAADGMHVFQGDVLKTGVNGTMGVMFIDNTRISLGPESELTLDRYVFEPTKSKFGLLARIVKGTTSYISGKMSKLSPDSVSFQTPSATIGSRGTSFLIKVDAD